MLWQTLLVGAEAFAQFVEALPFVSTFPVSDGIFLNVVTRLIPAYVRTVPFALCTLSQAVELGES